MSRNAGYHVLDLSKVTWTGTAPNISGAVKPEEYVSLVSSIETGKPVLVSGYDAPEGPQWGNVYASQVYLYSSKVWVRLGDDVVNTLFAISSDGSIALTYAD